MQITPLSWGIACSRGNHNIFSTVVHSALFSSYIKLVLGNVPVFFYSDYSTVATQQLKKRMYLFGAQFLKMFSNWPVTQQNVIIWTCMDVVCHFSEIML